MKNFKVGQKIKYSRKWLAQFTDKEIEEKLGQGIGVIIQVAEAFKLQKTSSTHIDATLVNVQWLNKKTREWACNLTQTKDINTFKIIAEKGA